MRKTVLKYIYIGVILFLGLMPVSCGKEKIKPVSGESGQALEAFALAETIREAFIKNDMDTLRENSTEDGYRDITANSKDFDSLELTFTPRWVEIEGQEIYLNIAWKSSWTSSGKQVEDRGMAVFVLEGRPLKVAKILRANPFSHPELSR